MLRWALIFFVSRHRGSHFRVGGIAGDAAWIGKILLLVFLVLAVLSLLWVAEAPQSHDGC